MQCLCSCSLAASRYSHLSSSRQVGTAEMVVAMARTDTGLLETGLVSVHVAYSEAERSHGVRKSLMTGQRPDGRRKPADT